MRCRLITSRVKVSRRFAVKDNQAAWARWCGDWGKGGGREGRERRVGNIVSSVGSRAINFRNWSAPAYEHDVHGYHV